MTEAEERLGVLAAQMSEMRGRLAQLASQLSEVEQTAAMAARQGWRPYDADQYAGPFAVRAFKTTNPNDTLRVGDGFIFAGNTAWAQFPTYANAWSYPTGADEVSVSTLGTATWVIGMKMQVVYGTGMFDANYHPRLLITGEAQAHMWQSAMFGAGCVLATVKTVNGAVRSIRQEHHGAIYVPVTHDTYSSTYTASLEIAGKMV